MTQSSEPQSLYSTRHLIQCRDATVPVTRHIHLTQLFSCKMFDFEPIQFPNNILRFEGTKGIPNIIELPFKRLRKLVSSFGLHSMALLRLHKLGQAVPSLGKCKGPCSCLKLGRCATLIQLQIWKEKVKGDDLEERYF